MSFTTALIAGATALTVGSQIRQGQQQQQVFQFNAAVNRQKAELAREAGQIRSDRLRREKRKFTARQTAAFAAAGVRLTGSPLQTLSDTAAEIEFDIMVEDFNTRVSILNAQTAGELDIIRGEQSRTASLISSGTTLLTQIPNFITSQNRARI